MKEEQEHFFLTQIAMVLLAMWRCPVGSGNPLGHTSLQHTCAQHMHSSCSLWGCFATWDFMSSQEHLRTRRKDSKLWVCLHSTEGKLPNGPGNVNKKIKWQPLRGSWIFRFFSIFALLHMQEGRGRGNQPPWTVWLVLSIPHLPSQELFLWKVLIFFPLLRNNYCF